MSVHNPAKRGSAPDAKRGPRAGDSSSLWNFTASPGWSNQERELLVLLLQVYGVGNWKAIVESNMLPGKRITQLNGQSQRLVGQQSLAAYSRLSLDLDRIKADNDAKTDVRRKGGLIIWQGKNPTTAMRNKWRAAARAKYELPKEQQAEARRKLEALMTAKQEQEIQDRLTSEAVTHKPVIHLDPSLMSRAEKEATWLFLRRKLQEWTSTVAEAQVSGDKRCERAEHQCSTLVSTSAQDKADGADLSFQAVLADLAMKSHKQRSWDRCWTAVQRYHAQQLAAAGNLHRSNSLIRQEPMEEGPTCRQMLRQTDTLAAARDAAMHQAVQQAREAPSTAATGADISMSPTAPDVVAARHTDGQVAYLVPQHLPRPPRPNYRPSAWAPLSLLLPEKVAPMRKRKASTGGDAAAKLKATLAQAVRSSEEPPAQAAELAYANAAAAAAGPSRDATATAAAVKDHISQAQAQNDYVLAQSRPAADMQEDTAQQEDAAAKPAAPQPKKAARPAAAKKRPAAKAVAKPSAPAMDSPAPATAPDPRLTQIMEMGFDRRHAHDALKEANGNVGLAIEWLMTHLCN